MYKVKQQKKVELRDGASVTVRGLTSREVAAVPDDVSMMDRQNEMLKSGVVSFDGFESESGAPTNGTDGEWLLDNVPAGVLMPVVEAITSLTFPDTDEKKD